MTPTQLAPPTLDAQISALAMEALRVQRQGVTPRRAGFASRPTTGWTVRRITTATGPQWATVALDADEEIGVLLGRAYPEALAALRAMVPAP